MEEEDRESDKQNPEFVFLSVLGFSGMDVGAGVLLYIVQNTFGLYGTGFAGRR